MRRGGDEEVGEFETSLFGIGIGFGSSETVVSKVTPLAWGSACTNYALGHLHCMALVVAWLFAFQRG